MFRETLVSTVVANFFSLQVCADVTEYLHHPIAHRVFFAEPVYPRCETNPAPICLRLGGNLALQSDHLEPNHQPIPLTSQSGMDALSATRTLHVTRGAGGYVAQQAAKLFLHERLACSEKVPLMSPQDCSVPEDWCVRLCQVFLLPQASN